MSNHLKIYALVLLAVCGLCDVAWAQSILQDGIEQAVLTHFRNLFPKKENDLRISYLRFPDTSELNDADYQIEVYSQRAQPKLGYQTLWVKLSRQGRLIKKLPVSASVSITANVLIARHKINRGVAISADMLFIEQRTIEKDWDMIYQNSEAVIGLESLRVIAAGETITKNLLRLPPAIYRGQMVKLQIQAGSLIITTDGVAKDDGAIGEKILVQNLATGKQLLAMVESPGLAVIEGKSE